MNAEMRRPFAVMTAAILYLLTTACPAPAYAAPGKEAVPGLDPLTLSEAVRLALSQNPQLRSELGRVQAAAGRAEQSRLWSNPELEIATEDLPAGGGRFRESKNTVGIAQTLPWPGKKALDGRIGLTDVRVRAAEAEWRRLQLVREVKTAFYRVLAWEKLVAVSGELVRVAEASAEATARRVEAGAAADQEQLRTEIQLEQGRSEQAGLERDLVMARQALALLVGRSDLSSAPITGSLPDTFDPVRLQASSPGWMESHPRVQVARFAHERAKMEVRRAGLEPYPDVRVGVEGGREGPGDDAIVQFRISVPLPLIDRARGRQKEAKANLESAEADLAAEQQRLVHDWQIVSAQLRGLQAQVNAYRERILPKAIEALRLVRAGFEEGKFGLTDLLDTQRTAAEARLAYQQKLFELNAAVAELESLLGEGPAVSPKAFEQGIP